MKALVIIRGIPGSGKTTFAEVMASGKYPVLAADDYFMVDGVYKFNPALLGKAHQSCQDRCQEHMVAGTQKIFVSNTSTRGRDLSPYIKMAQDNGYVVFSVIVENRHGGKDVHNVPEEALVRMEDQLRNNLKFR